MKSIGDDEVEGNDDEETEENDFELKIKGDLTQHEREIEVMNVMLTCSETFVSTYVLIILY